MLKSRCRLGCIPFWNFWERIYFQAHLNYWQKLVPWDQESQVLVAISKKLLSGLQNYPYTSASGPFLLYGGEWNVLCVKPLTALCLISRPRLKGSCN